MNRLDLYTRVSEHAASVVIHKYSTSFRLASRLLAEPVRQQVANIYALVRIADEIVDGATDGAGLSLAEAARALTELEDQTHAAMESGYCTNPIVHAFARTARSTGIGKELTEPFFASMRSDLDQTAYDVEGFKRYVYGSAEVIGLMCLHSFLSGESRSVVERQHLEKGARALGAAFQKVNFLRDLRADYHDLGRVYFPGLNMSSLSDGVKREIEKDIQADLDAAYAGIRRLPMKARFGVYVAYRYYSSLFRKIQKLPPADSLSRRIRISNPVKLLIICRAGLKNGLKMI